MNEQPILAGFIDELHRLKRVGERGIAQLRDEDFFFRLNPQQNSIAVIMQHVAGNMKSRWTDFLTADGDKPWRNREGEFVDRGLSRAELLRIWEEGWAHMFRALAELRDSDLTKTITIRGEAMSAVAALARSIGHYGWHVGQILMLAKHLAGGKWDYVTIPPARR